MLKRLVVLLILAAALPSWGAACFREHLEDAMVLNKKRLPLYVAAGGSEIADVSNRLIAMEERMLRFSRVFSDYDQKAAPFEAAGVRVVCDSYVSMSLTPPFLPMFPQGPVPESRLASPRGLVSRAELWRAYVGGFERTHQVVLAHLERMASEPRQFCLTRHFLESMGRIAALAPRHEAQAKALGLPSPTFLHRRMIRDHLLILHSAIELDEAAMPFHRRGVPILCRDVPPIEVPAFPSGL